MKDDHLVNAIRFLRRQAQARILGELTRLGRYMQSAPDGAYDAANAEVSALIAMTDDEYLVARIPAYRRMLDEARRRKLLKRL